MKVFPQFIPKCIFAAVFGKYASLKVKVKENHAGFLEKQLEKNMNRSKSVKNNKRSTFLGSTGVTKTNFRDFVKQGVTNKETILINSLAWQSYYNFVFSFCKKKW